jgi:hypothetical protein
MGEKIELNSRPAAVQQTIKETAAGGEVLRVKREDDPHGKWNYEAVANTNGKNGDSKSIQTDQIVDQK